MLIPTRYLRFKTKHVKRVGEKKVVRANKYLIFIDVERLSSLIKFFKTKKKFFHYRFPSASRIFLNAYFNRWNNNNNKKKSRMINRLSRKPLSFCLMDQILCRGEKRAEEAPDEHKRPAGKPSDVGQIASTWNVRLAFYDSALKLRGFYVFPPSSHFFRSNNEILQNLQATNRSS